MEDDIAVVAQVSSGTRSSTALEIRPDVAMLDIEAGHGRPRRGSSAANSDPGSRVLVVTTFGRPGYLHGAGGRRVRFVLKDAPASQLAIAIRQVAAGRRVVDRRSLSTPCRKVRTRCRIANGKCRRGTDQATVADIAQAMTLSRYRSQPPSAASRRSARNRAEAARIALDKGWLDPPR
jgi:two-component system response regulator DesR